MKTLCHLVLVAMLTQSAAADPSPPPIEVDSLASLRTHLAVDHANVRMKPGTYLSLIHI